MSASAARGETSRVGYEVFLVSVPRGADVEETGEALGLSRAMAYRNWKYARPWLREALKK